MTHFPRIANPLHGRAWPKTLVTGATSGIGLALTQLLAEAGVPVVALGRNAGALAPLQAQYPTISFVRCDLSDLAALPALAAELLGAHPDLGCLINNAGMQHNLCFEEGAARLASIQEEVDVNLTSPMVLTGALLGHLRSQPAAWVVNITSGLAYAPKRSAAVYSATKAGLHLFTQALRLQMQGASVRVVEAVMPLVDTPMTHGRGHNKMPAGLAAGQVLQGLVAGRDVIWVGKARGIPVLQRLAPGVLARLMQAA
ncbi:MAG TPA: SDR family NAD(P)-dependent oxidoreductase [Hydrogenophaga sp.]